MTSKTRRLAFTAGFVVLLALTLWSWLPGSAGQANTPHSATAAEPAEPDLAPAPQLSDPATTADGHVTPPLESDRQSYALGLHDIAGLAQDSAPGTVVDLWVAWDPPITAKPQFQRLIPSVVIEEIMPPFTPEGPVTVMISVPTKKIGDLLYADRYGAISATLPR